MPELQVLRQLLQVVRYGYVSHFQRQHCTNERKRNETFCFVGFVSLLRQPGFFPSFFFFNSVGVQVTGIPRFGLSLYGASEMKREFQRVPMAPALASQRRR